MRFFGIRFKETLLTQFIVSVIASAVFHFDILEQTKKGCAYVMLLCIVINGVKLFLDLKGYRLFSGVHRREFYKVNFTVTGIMTAVAVIMAKLNLEPVYTWLFFPFKILYTLWGLPKSVSAFLVGAVFIIITAVVPFIVKVEMAETEEMADEIITSEKA